MTLQTGTGADLFDAAQIVYTETRVIILAPRRDSTRQHLLVTATCGEPVTIDRFAAFGVFTSEARVAVTAAHIEETSFVGEVAGACRGGKSAPITQGVAVENGRSGTACQSQFGADYEGWTNAQVITGLPTVA